MIPFNVTFRDLAPSEAVRFDVQTRVEKLERFSRKIMSCDVIISEPHRRHHQGKLFHVHLKIHVPGKKIVVSHDPDHSGRHQDMRAAIGDAFDEAERQLEDYERERRLWKQDRPGGREEIPEGKIRRIFYNEDYGFLETQDGREIYFHKNSVLGAKFQDLRVGDKIYYSEEAGDQGPQVSTMWRHRKALSETMQSSDFL